jgi:hypothetical protein
LRDLSAERKRLWAEWQQEFNIQPMQRRKQNQSRGGGRDKARSGSRSPAPFDSLAGRFADSQFKAGWKKHRSAAQGKAEGDYRPRDRERKGLRPGM